MTFESVYRLLPVWAQHIACSLEGWRIGRSRYGVAFLEELRQAEVRAEWPAERICEFRDERLRAFVRHAAETVPYYRELFLHEQIDPAGIRNLDDLGQLPVLTKQDVKRLGARLFSESVPARKRTETHTSGTTGGGLRLPVTLEAIQRQWAVWWRYRRWHGITSDTWCGYFGGRSVVSIHQNRPPFWRCNLPGRQILFSGYHMSRENLPAYVSELRRRQPPWIHGYPSLLALLASYLLDSQDDLGYQPQAITIGAESLLPQQAAVIRRALGVSPRQHYGMAEAVANISEWPDGMLRVDEDFAAVEFLPTGIERQFRVVGTNFTNLAAPLIRYDVGDLVTLPAEPEENGCPGRVVEAIDGRKEDYVLLPGGARLGRMDHIFKDMVRIQEVQIYQRQVGELTLRVVKGDGYSEADERQLLAETRRRVGDDTAVRIEYVDTLLRSRTGKLRLVISELAEGQLRQQC